MGPLTLCCFQDFSNYELSCVHHLHLGNIRMTYHGKIILFCSDSCCSVSPHLNALKLQSFDVHFHSGLVIALLWGSCTEDVRWACVLYVRVCELGMCFPACDLPSSFWWCLSAARSLCCWMSHSLSCSLCLCRLFWLLGSSPTRSWGIIRALASSVCLQRSGSFRSYSRWLQGCWYWCRNLSMSFSIASFSFTCLLWIREATLLLWSVAASIWRTRSPIQATQCTSLETEWILFCGW